MIRKFSLNVLYLLILNGLMLFAEDVSGQMIDQNNLPLLKIKNEKELEKLKDYLSRRKDRSYMMVIPPETSKKNTLLLLVKNEKSIQQIPIKRLKEINETEKFLLEDGSILDLPSLKEKWQLTTEYRPVKFPLPCQSYTEDLRLNLSWVGSDLNEEKAQTILHYCKTFRRDDDFIKSGKKLILTLWHDEHLKNDNPQLTKIKNECSRKNEQINFETKSVETLFAGEEIFPQAYEHFKKEALPAAASDVTRPLMMKKWGGCYLDLGFKFPDGPYLILNDYDGSKKFIHHYKLQSMPEEKEPLNLFSTGDTILHEEKEITGFHNNNFMISQNIESALKLSEEYKKRLKLFLDHPLLQIPLRKNEHFSTTGMLFFTTGPLAFTHSLNRGLNESEKMGALMENFKQNGKKSWRRPPSFWMERDLHRKILGLCVEKIHPQMPAIDHCLEYDLIGERDACLFVGWAEYLEKIKNKKKNSVKVEEELHSVQLFSKNFSSQLVYEKANEWCLEEGLRKHEETFDSEEKKQVFNMKLFLQHVEKINKGTYSQSPKSPSLCQEKMKSDIVVQPFAFEKEDLKCFSNYDPFAKKDASTFSIQCSCIYLSSDKKQMYPQVFYEWEILSPYKKIYQHFCSSIE